MPPHPAVPSASPASIAINKSFRSHFTREPTIGKVDMIATLNSHWAKCAGWPEVLRFAKNLVCNEVANGWGGEKTPYGRVWNRERSALKAVLQGEHKPTK